MKADTIQFKVGEQTVWINMEEWKAQENWYNMRAWMIGQCMMSGCDINDPELVKCAHEIFNIPQPKAIEPEQKSIKSVVIVGTTGKCPDGLKDIFYHPKDHTKAEYPATLDECLPIIKQIPHEKL